jgi:hypothetical protein
MGRSAVPNVQTLRRFALGRPRVRGQRIVLVVEAARLFGDAPKENAKMIAAGDCAGGLFTIDADFTDPDVYLLGEGVIETEPAFRDGSSHATKLTGCCAPNSAPSHRSRSWPASI